MTITTLRPNFDHKKVGISYSTGTSAWTLLQDDTDTTYIYVIDGKTYPNAYARINFDNMSKLPSNQKILRCRLRARIRMTAQDPGWFGTIDARMHDYGFGKSGNLTRFTTSNYTTVQERTGAWFSKTPANKPWREDYIRNTQAYLYWYWSQGSLHRNLRLYELYLDMDIRDKPTVGSVTVSGNDTSTRPTVAFDYTANADGDPQHWYQVKIFSQAQINSYLFDADKTKPTWSSGEVASTSESVKVLKDLSLNTTYTAYVKCAQRFNGQPWYSDWATSSTFTIIPAIPPVPVMTVTKDQTVPYLRNIISVTQNLNMLPGPVATFEDGTVAGWENGTNATSIGMQTPTAADGDYSLQFKALTSATMRVQTSTDLPSVPGLDGYLIPVAPNTQMTAVAYVATAVTARSVFVSIRWYDKLGVFISTSDGTASNDAVTFGKRTVTATSPSTARYAAVSVTVSSPLINEFHYVDHVSLHTGSNTDWIPPDASTVIETAWVTNSEGNLVHPQLWTGGEYEETANGFYTSGTSSTTLYDRSDQYHGIGCIKWMVDDATSKLYVGWPSGVEVIPEPIYPMAGVPDRTYSFSLRAKADASFSSRLNLQAIDKDGNTVGSAIGTNITITTSWAEYKVQNYLMPGDAVRVKAYLDNTGSVTGRWVKVDAVRWYMATAVPTALEQSTGGVETNWMAVRGADEDELVVVTGDSKVYVHDLEVPPGYTVLYQARNAAPETDVLPALSSAPTPQVATMIDSPGVWVLSLPGDGRLRSQVRVTDFQQTRHEETDTFYPLRPGGFSFPVVTSDFLGGRDGTITIKTKTEEEWRQLESLVRLPMTLWLVSPDFGARYIRVLDRSWKIVQLDKNMTWLREVTLPYLEVDRPSTTVIPSTVAFNAPWPW